MIGRNEETKDLMRAFESEQSEFVAVYGRRRVGKTFLVNDVFNGRFAFYAAGLESVPKDQQLESFWEALKRQGLPKCKKPRSWIAAFALLEDLLEAAPSGKKVVFLDELPWFDTHKSGFLAAFEGFWNGWCSGRKDILLIVCGSATTWIIKKVLRARGGLHNRVTRQIPLGPFTLAECEEYAAYRKLGFDRRQILECYMAFGGIAYYWSLLRNGLSAVQNIDRLFFGHSDELRTEYRKVFASLFKNASQHLEIVRLLGRKKIGLSREEIRAGLKEPSGGDVSECLEELEQCGFVRRYSPLGRIKKGAVFQLVDNYILFYFEFLEKRQGNDEQFWSHHGQSPAIHAWRGRAFERVCFWHVPQIKRALGISGIAADVYSWRGVSSTDGRPVQIDMLIDRADETINVCEMKYAPAAYAFTESEAAGLRRRAEALAEACGRRKAVWPVLVSPHGLSRNKYSDVVQGVVTSDDLFAK